MDEQWKDVDGYDGLYQISNKGRVKSTTFRKCVHGIKTVSKAEVIMQPINNGNGYLYITFTKDGKRKNHYIHRLVALAFLDNPHNLQEVNHKDYDKTNNSADNLEWCDRKYNISYSAGNMLRQHNFVGKTGIRYVGIDKNGRYRVYIKKHGTDRRFDNLDEAITYRNEVLNEIGYTV